jgi:hypothetical protein
MGVVEAPLGIGSEFPAVFLCDAGEGTLEVDRELTCIPTGRTTGDTVPLYQNHAAGGTSQEEENRGDSGDSRADDHDVSHRIGIKRLRRPVRAS